MTRLDNRVRNVPGGYVFEGLWNRGSPSNGCDLLMNPDFNWPIIPDFEGYGGGTSFSRYKTFTIFLVNSFDDAGLNFETGNKVVAQVSLIVNVRGNAAWHDSSTGFPYGYNWTSVWNQSVNGTTKQCSLGVLSNGPILRFGVDSSGITLAGGDQEALGYGETFQYR